MPSFASSRARLAVTAIAVGAALLVAALVAALSGPGAPAADRAATTAPAPPPSALARSIQSMQVALSRSPQDATTWARLGAAFVEQARTSGDPRDYDRAEQALRRSVREQPEDNGFAWIGLGALANARHDFAQARDWGERARRVLPATAAVHGVLTDAYTQLGDTEAATEALQRMLDLKPGVPSFTRASYAFQSEGRTAEATEAMSRALADATDPGDIAFCRYYLGELAFDQGDLDGAAHHYEAGLRADPGSVPPAQGLAKVAAARGDLDAALAGYAELVTRAPLPQYLQEYARLLTAAGRSGEAEAQYQVLAAQQRLLAESGATDSLAASSVAADRGRRAEALRLARAEWQRRRHVDVADALAWALHLNGRDAEALTFADLAAAPGARNATFAYHRGMILRALGRQDAARAALARALKINPHFSPLDAPRARAALTALRSTT